MESTHKDSKMHSTFNGEYEVMECLGEGKTSRVYLCRHIQDPAQKVALKLLRQDFLCKDQEAVASVEQEIQILHGLDHQGITKILGYGSDGRVVKPSGREIGDLVYILLEYVPGGLLFDLCESAGGVGEQGGRYFMEQLTNVLAYLARKKVAHRDLKLENILVDENLNLKVADFGFATFKKVGALQSYRGTKTYMAPEIKAGQVYDGRQTDIFSAGVILYILVQGIFPFGEAKKDDYYYKLLLEGKHEKYWKRTGGEALSDDFKDLVLKMLSHDPAKRPTVEELQNHPWMKQPYEPKKARTAIIESMNGNKSDKSTVDTESASRSACRTSI